MQIPQQTAASDASISVHRSLTVSARSQRQRSWLLVAGFLILTGLGWTAVDRLLIGRNPIVVGILHSQTGPMAVSEKSMIDAEVLALEEVNAGGGLLGRQVKWVIADGGFGLADVYPTGREAHSR